jgi:O-antigen ligase
LASIISSLVSVFLFGALLGLAILVWLWDCFRRRRLVLKVPPFYWLLFAFLGLVAVSILTSPDPLASVPYLKKFIKLLSFALVYTYVTRDQLRRALGCLLLLAGLSAFWGLAQYFWFKNVTLLSRIDGFMSHWMTFSGQMMICAVITLALLLAARRHLRTAPSVQLGLLILFPLFCGATLLTFTRSAWLGLASGCVVLLALSRLRWAAAGFAFLLATFLLLPGSFHSRLISSFDRNDTTTRGRLELFQAGIDLVREHPWTGVGPRLVQRAAAREANGEFPDWMYQHLHNNVLQIAAELGLPALLAWLAVWVKILVDLLLMSRSSDELTRAMSWSGIGVVVSVQLMGLFEYNFGDSEIVALTLFTVTAAYLVRRRGAAGDRPVLP